MQQLVWEAEHLTSSTELDVNSDSGGFLFLRNFLVVSEYMCRITNPVIHKGLPLQQKPRDIPGLV